MASQYNLPVVFHCRDMHSQMLEIAKKNISRHHPIHLHCFDGTVSRAKDWLDNFNNLYMGFTNLIHFKYKLRNVVKNIPLGRLLIETDSPYFAIYGEKNFTTRLCY